MAQQRKRARATWGQIEESPQGTRFQRGVVDGDEKERREKRTPGGATAVLHEACVGGGADGSCTELKPCARCKNRNSKADCNARRKKCEEASSSNNSRDLFGNSKSMLERNTLSQQACRGSRPARSSEQLAAENEQRRKLHRPKLPSGVLEEVDSQYRTLSMHRDVLAGEMEKGVMDPRSIGGAAFRTRNRAAEAMIACLQAHADKNCGEALFELALLYLFYEDDGIPRDEEKARDLLLRALALKYTGASYYLGYLDREKGTEIILGHLRLAVAPCDCCSKEDCGHSRYNATAALSLGMLLLHGIVPYEGMESLEEPMALSASLVEEAIQSLMTAASNGCRYSRAELCIWNICRDFELALNYLKEAALDKETIDSASWCLGQNIRFETLYSWMFDEDSGFASVGALGHLFLTEELGLRLSSDNHDSVFMPMFPHGFNDPFYNISKDASILLPWAVEGKLVVFDRGGV